MKIKKVSTYKAPRYPTLIASQATPQILERIPSRWLAEPFAKLLGAGILAQTLLSCSNDDKRQPSSEIIQLSPAGDMNSRQRKAVSQIKRIGITVAPFLEEAMASDGRGTFGCVATDPPVYLAENEAIEMIRTELQKAGLELEDSFQVDHLQVPVGSDPENAEKEVYGKHEIMMRDGVRSEPGSYVFDLGNKDLFIAIEFLSLSDYDYWMGEPLSTAPSYNLPVLMNKLRKSFEGRQQGKPVTIGLFFDPLVRQGRGSLPPIDGLDEQQRAFVKEQTVLSRRYSSDFLVKQAREKLFDQVQYFIEYLRKEGILPAQ